MADKFTPRVQLEGVTFNINDTCVNAPIVIGGDCHNHESDGTDLAPEMQSVKSPRNPTTYGIQEKKREITGEGIKNIKSNNTKASAERKIIMRVLTQKNRKQKIKEFTINH